MRDGKSKQNMMAAESWFINTMLKKASSISLKPKAFEDVCVPPPERSEAERRGTSSTLTSSLTLTNAFRSNINNSEFPPIVDRQEKKIISY